MRISFAHLLLRCEWQAIQLVTKTKQGEIMANEFRKIIQALCGTNEARAVSVIKLNEVTY